ncbi:MAG: lipopolysaccharide kinase InaA family protein [Desulfobacterales bacterium]
MAELRVQCHYRRIGEVCELRFEQDNASRAQEDIELETFLAPIECVNSGNLLFNRPFVNLFKVNGLDRFDAIWELSNGDFVKRIPSRSVMRFMLRDGTRNRQFFIKRHYRERVGCRRIPFPMGYSRASSQGMLEFENCRLFRRNGLATVHPVASGERARLGGSVESFFISEDYSPFVSLESLIAQQPEFFEGDVGIRRKKDLILAIAGRARQMHAAGFHHLDFNATHILVHYDEKKATPFTIAFFDLQRVDKNPWSKWRWMNKGLARLSCSLPDPLFSTRDRLQLLLSYKNLSRPNLLGRFQWFWLNRKMNRIRRHTCKIDDLKNRERDRLGIPRP